MQRLLVVLGVLATALPLAAQEPLRTRSLSDEAGSAARIVGRGVVAPLDWSAQTWLAVGGATLGLAVLSVLDGDVRDAARRNRAGFLDDAAGIAKPFGKEGSAAALAAFLVAGLALEDGRARAVAFDGIAATVLASALLVPVLQETIGRSRPWHGRGEYAFKALSGRHSLPSGHTAQAFVTAAVVAAHYDTVWVDVAAWGVAGAVGLSRIVFDAHHLTDVVAGAAIGTLVTGWVVRQGADDRVRSITPAVGPGSVGLKLWF